MKHALYMLLPSQPTPGLNQEARKVINSVTCKEKTAYSVRVLDEVVEGGVIVVYSQKGDRFGGWRICITVSFEKILSY